MTNNSSPPDLIVIGGGLAGSEAALQAANCGLNVHLYEMRPILSTGAHVTDYLAELVCSNSLGSNELFKASGLLKKEMEILGSEVLKIALETTVPAGGALAVDRIAFAQGVTEKIISHPRISLIRQEAPEIPNTPTIIASGPLTSLKLSNAIEQITGKQHLYFFDAISPIVSYDSIDMTIAFRGARYGIGSEEEGDYINCPMTQEEYDRFIDALLSAERIELKEFERGIEDGVRAGVDEYFEGCLPIEIMAKSGKESLAYGPMRPIGLTDRRNGKRSSAIVQLRQDNLSGSLYNIVGFQTNLTFKEQKKVFQMIPGLENAKFERFGQMHRNTFIFSPQLLEPTLQSKQRADLFFAGQICGVEGYAGNIATGLLAGLNAARLLQNKSLLSLPKTSMLGALCYYITHADARDFQPMKANFGLFTPVGRQGKKKPGRKERGEIYAEIALRDLGAYLESQS